MSRFTTQLPLAGDRHVTLPDLWNRARGAAKLALRGESYSYADREDCAARLVAEVWREAQRTNRLTSVVALTSTSLQGTGAVSYSAKNRQKSKDDGTATWARVEAIDAKLIKGSKLYGMASNARRTIDRDRDRAEREALANARLSGFLPHVVAETDETRGRHPYAAHMLALEMCSALGVDDARGPAYYAAYAASRASAGLESRAIARELGLTLDTLGKYLRRSGARIPSVKHYGEAEHAEALHVPDYGKPAHGRTPLLASDWRTRTGKPAPIKLGRVRTRRPWDGKRCAAWAELLKPGQRARFTLWAKSQRARAAGKPEAHAKRDRLAAGIPG